MIDIDTSSLPPYSCEFIEGYIEGFSEEVAGKFEKEIRENLLKKTEELVEKGQFHDVSELMNEVADSFYYFWNVISKEEVDKLIEEKKNNS